MSKSRKAAFEAGIGMVFVSSSLFCFGAAFLAMRSPAAQTLWQPFPRIGIIGKKPVVLEGGKSGILEVQNIIPLYLVTLGKKDGMRVDDVLNVYDKGGNNIGKVKITHLYDLGADVILIPDSEKYRDGFYRVTQQN